MPWAFFVTLRSSLGGFYAAYQWKDSRIYVANECQPQRVLKAARRVIFICNAVLTVLMAGVLFPW